MTAAPAHTGLPLHLCGVVLPGWEKRDVYVIGGRISFDEPADAEVHGWLDWTGAPIADSEAGTSSTRRSGRAATKT